MARFRWLAFLICLGAGAQTAPQEIEVPASQPWTDTGIDVRPGDALLVTAEGALQLPGERTCGPDGHPRGFRDLLKAYPSNDAGLGALIGRIGSSDAAQPFLVGASKEIKVRRNGRLFLGINRQNESLDGSFHVKVEFTARGSEAKPAADVNVKLPAVTVAMIDRLPRRVADSEGNAGDNTNFIVIGNEKQVIEAFEAAGWVKVDRSPRDAFLTGLIATLSKQAYVQLPMSELTLFGRPQDYGLAHAEPIAVVAQRHHLRLWKAPFQVDGQELWVGAATHDIGFDKDQRNGKVTHRIDPAIDDERDFVGRSLDETGLVAKLSYLTPATPSKEARTATGASFHSDGRVLVITLVPSPSDTQAPARLQ